MSSRVFKLPDVLSPGYSDMVQIRSSSSGGQVQKEMGFSGILILNYVMLGEYPQEIVYSFFSNNHRTSGMLALPSPARLVQVYM